MLGLYKCTTLDFEILQPGLEVINHIAALKVSLKSARLTQQKIALVPTMGALHKGHVSLVKKAQKLADIVVCSIFVNPTQFTDPKDLEKYPRPLEHDIRMLEEAGCDFVFMPSVTEMYPGPEDWQIDLGAAEFLLEGEFRKGHYQGVTQIVKKLFDTVNPDLAFFGQKDYQQVLMIKNMINELHLPVEVVTCPIIREEDGLAMSSRNIHLTSNERVQALALSKALFYIRDHFKHQEIPELLLQAEKIIMDTAGVELDYLTIVNGDTLLPLVNRDTAAEIVALVAAKVGQTRLIDNIILN